MRSEQIKAYLNNRLFAICPSYLTEIVGVLNQGGDIARAETSNEISNSHSYQEINNVALISIDGVMIKKNTFFNALSGAYVPYDAIMSYLDKAESNPKITDVILDIDTRGGDVEGVDRFSSKIKSMSKRTHTFYSNKGASAGIWFGTASDKIYAEETAILGSIGVMAMMLKPKDEESDEKVVLVSKNAENKNCSVNGDCMARVQKRIDETETIFYKRVMEHTGLNEEEIKTEFNNGDMISATKALEIGFIDGVTTLDELIKTLVAKDGTVPPERKPVAINQKKESVMAVEDTENLVAIERARTANIAALGSRYGVSAEAIQSAITDGAEVSAFQTICLESMEARLSAQEEESQATISDLQSRLEASIQEQSTDGEATVEHEEEKVSKEDEQNEAVLAYAKNMKV